MSISEEKFPVGHIPHAKRPPLKPKRRIRLPRFLTKSKNLVGVFLVLVVTAAAIMFALFGADIVTFLGDLGEDQAITVSGEEFNTDAEHNDTAYDTTRNGVTLAAGKKTGTYLSRVFDAGGLATWNNISYISSEFEREDADPNLSLGLSFDPDFAQSETINATPANPVLHLSLDEADPPFADTTGKQQPGTCEGDVCPENTSIGYLGNGKHFDGQDDYIVVPDSENLPGDRGSFSIWINPEVYLYSKYMIARSVPGTSINWSLTGGDRSSVTFRMFDANLKDYTLNSGRNTVLPNELTHVVATWEMTGENQTKVILYTNGLKQAEGTLDTAPVSGGDVSLGRQGEPPPGRGSYTHYTGYLDDIRLYTDILSLDQVYTLYLEGDPTLHLNLDEEASPFADSTNNHDPISCEDPICPENTTDSYTGNAKYFNGQDDYLVLPDSEYLPGNKGAFAVWIKPEVYNYREHIIARSVPGTSINWSMTTGDRKSITFRMRDEEFQEKTLNSGRNSVPQDQWTHVIASWEQVSSTQTKMTIYTNGEKRSEAIYDFVPIDEGDLNLGVQAAPAAGREGITNYTGFLDDVKLYMRSIPPDKAYNIYKELSATEVTKTTYLDQSANQSNAFQCQEERNCPTTTDRDGNEALLFDGKDDHLTIPSHDNMPTRDAGTIAFYVNPSTSYNGKTLVARNKDANWSNTSWALVGGDANSIALKGPNNTTIMGGRPYGTVPQNQWTHFTLTWSKNQDGTYHYTQYANGEIKKEADSATALGENHNINIGWWAKVTIRPNAFPGALDEVKIFNKTLSQEEVIALTQPPVSPETPLTLRARSCDDDACDGEPWKDCTEESCDLSDIPENRYFQFEVTLNSNTTAVSKLLEQVDIEYGPPECAGTDDDEDGSNACVDCDDGNPMIYPDADNDADGYDACRDCNDNDQSVHPGAIEECDGKDNDCDNRQDEYCSYQPVATKDYYSINMHYKEESDQDNVDLQDEPVSTGSYEVISIGPRGLGEYGATLYDSGDNIVDIVFFDVPKTERIYTTNGKDTVNQLDDADFSILVPKTIDPPVARIEIESLTDPDFLIEIVIPNDVPFADSGLNNNDQVEKIPFVPIAEAQETQEFTTEVCPEELQGNATTGEAHVKKCAGPEYDDIPYIVYYANGTETESKVRIYRKHVSNMKAIASPDYAETSLDNTIEIPVLENDYDPDSGTASNLQISTSFQDESRGSVEITGDNKLRYTPPTNYQGDFPFIVSVPYEVYESEIPQEKDIAEVHITITLLPAQSISVRPTLKGDIGKSISQQITIDVFENDEFDDNLLSGVLIITDRADHGNAKQITDSLLEYNPFESWYDENNKLTSTGQTVADLFLEAKNFLPELTYFPPDEIAIIGLGEGSFGKQDGRKLWLNPQYIEQGDITLTHELAHQFQSNMRKSFGIDHATQNREIIQQYAEMYKRMIQFVNNTYAEERNCNFNPNSFDLYWLGQALKKPDNSEFSRDDVLNALRFIEPTSPNQKTFAWALNWKDPKGDYNLHGPRSHYPGTTRAYGTRNGNERFATLYESILLEAREEQGVFADSMGNKYHSFNAIYENYLHDYKQEEKDVMNLSDDVKLLGKHCLIADADHDGVPDSVDNCESQEITWCMIDSDGKDGLDYEKCSNPDQKQDEGNSVGNICMCEPGTSYCANVAEKCCGVGYGCADANGDGVNECVQDLDKDDVYDNEDNCDPSQYCYNDLHGETREDPPDGKPDYEDCTNPEQEDSNGNGVGNVCDETPEETCDEGETACGNECCNPETSLCTQSSDGRQYCMSIGACELRMSSTVPLGEKWHRCPGYPRVSGPYCCPPTRWAKCVRGGHCNMAP
ncbi:LamG-like jellyroll fold domain-containing protein [Patescibacteria group bacterium]